MFLSRSRTYDLPITSSDALPRSYRRLVSGDSGILGKNPSAPFARVEPTTFRLLVWMLDLGAIGDSLVVTRGYSEKIRVLLLHESNLRPSDYQFGCSTSEL